MSFPALSAAGAAASVMEFCRLFDCTPGVGVAVASSVASGVGVGVSVASGVGVTSAAAVGAGVADVCPPVLVWTSVPDAAVTIVAVMSVVLPAVKSLGYR